jgi:hypothetical protein
MSFIDARENFRGRSFKIDAYISESELLNDEKA